MFLFSRLFLFDIVYEMKMMKIIFKKNYLYILITQEMLVSLNWIKEYVDLTENNPQKISDILTEKSAEVEEIIYQGKELDNVVVGKIIEISSHPEADKIKITKTEVANGEILQIICGGSNISEGMLVPVALPGAVLPGDFRIKKGKIRGVESLGMLCGADEINISSSVAGKTKIWEQEKSILEILGDVKLGTPLAEYLGKDDIIFEIENTSITNRADQFCHAGFAQEFVACNLGKLQQNIYSSADEKNKNNISSQSFPIEISFPENAEKIIPEYCAIAISGVDGKTQSPEKMKKLLESVNITPHNALVDITNFVMFELGMPLHAFDRKSVGNKWSFELTKGGEKMVNLDGEEKTLPENAIVLKDETGEIFDCCGIQGGKNSGITNETSEIILHAPIYDAVKIRRTSIAIAQRTDASILFEKSIPLALAKKGLMKAIEYIQEIFPEAKIESEIFQKSFTDKKDVIIEISLQKIHQQLGIDISTDEITKILKSLAFEVAVENNIFTITVPFFRGDISIPADITEEIARIYGLNNIEGVAPEIIIEEKPQLPSRKVEQKVAKSLVENGFYEILTLAFYGEKLLKRMQMPTDGEEKIFVKNPLSNDVNIMRTSLSPRLFEVAERNMKNVKTGEGFRIFESGKIFQMQKNTDGILEKIETHRITCLLVGDDFFSAKSIAEDIFSAFNMPARIQSKKYELSFAHPARGAVMTAGKNSSVKVFEVHPKISKEFGLPKNSSVVCLDIPSFEPILGKLPKMTSLPKFPAIDFDVSVLCDENISVEKLVKGLTRLDDLIVRAEVESVWRGEGVENGKKSVTLSFSFQSPERTLKEKEAKKLEKLLLAEVKKRGGEERF